MMRTVGFQPLRWIVLVLVLVLAGSCGSPRERQTPAVKRTINLTPRSATVVARVAGAPILASELRWQMVHSGKDARTSLSALIQLEVLAAEARRRRIDQRPAVLDVQRRAMATRLTKEAFGDTMKPSSIDPALVAHAYRLNIHRYVRFESVQVQHILCAVTRHSSAAVRAGAERCVAAAREFTSKKTLTLEQFKALRPLLAKRALPAQVRTESLVTPQRGVTVPAFADAAFALKKKGAISPPVKTRFGYHVIYLIDRRPALNKPLATVDSLIRTRIFDEASRIMFDRWARKLEARYHAQAFPAALARALGADSKGAANSRAASRRAKEEGPGR